MRRFASAVVVGLLVALSAGCSTSAPPQAGQVEQVARVQQVDPATFATDIEGDRFTINVHIPDEGSLPATDLTLPYDEIQDRAEELPADRATPLAIYCMTGHMSAIAGQTLIGLGYTDIVELDGGMEAWQASGRSLIPAV